LPIPSYGAFIGVAKANPSTYLTAATAVGAVSIPVNGTVVPVASTIYFIDGANSESRAVTAGGGSGTLTVAATTYAHGTGCVIYWQLTAALGPVDYIPVTTFPDASDAIATVSDTGIRGSNVSEYGVYQVVGHSDINLAGDVIPDTFGWLLGSVYGAVDFAGASPNVHTFASMNVLANGLQPTPLMIWVCNGYNTRLYVGCKASDVTITYDPLQLLKWTAKLQGFLGGVVATPTPSFSAIVPQSAWQSTITIAGVLITTMLAGTITISRTSLAAIPSLDGNQSPYAIWSGQLKTAGTLSFVVEADNDLIKNNYIKNTQPAVVLAFTNGTGATQVGLSVQMTRCNFIAGWKDADKGGYVDVSGPISGVANLTDANVSGTGYSPSRVVLRNAVAASRYQ